MDKISCEKFLRSICNKDDYIVGISDEQNGFSPVRKDNTLRMYNHLIELSGQYSSYFSHYYKNNVSYFIEKGSNPFISQDWLIRTKSFIELFDTDLHESYHALVSKKAVENWDIVPLDIQEKSEKYDIESVQLLKEKFSNGYSLSDMKEFMRERDEKLRIEYPEVKYWEEYVANMETILWFPHIGQNEFSIKMVKSPQFKDMIQCIPNEVVDLLHIYEPYICPDTKNNSFSSDFFAFFDEFITAGHSALASAECISMAYDLYCVNDEKNIFPLNAAVDQLIKNDCEEVEFRFMVWIEYFYFISIYLRYSHENDNDFFMYITNDQAIKRCIISMIELLKIQKEKYLVFKNKMKILTNLEYDNSVVCQHR